MTDIGKTVIIYFIVKLSTRNGKPVLLYRYNFTVMKSLILIDILAVCFLKIVGIRLV